MIKITFNDGKVRKIKEYNSVNWGDNGLLTIDSRLVKEGRFVIPFSNIREVQMYDN